MHITDSIKSIDEPSRVVEIRRNFMSTCNRILGDESLGIDPGSHALTPTIGGYILPFRSGARLRLISGELDDARLIPRRTLLEIAELLLKASDLGNLELTPGETRDIVLYIMEAQS